MVLFLIPEIGNRGSQLVHNSFFCGNYPTLYRTAAGLCTTAERNQVKRVLQNDIAALDRCQ